VNELVQTLERGSLNQSPQPPLRMAVRVHQRLTSWGCRSSNPFFAMMEEEDVGV